MEQLEEKLVVPRPSPIPFVMDPRYFNFGLSERLTQDLNKTIYKAELEYVKKCADAQSEMLKKIQDFLRGHRI